MSRQRTEEHLKNLRASVKAACNDPELRARLDALKRNSPEQVTEIINDANSRWTVLSGLEDYKTQSTKTFHCRCQAGHETMLSLNCIRADVRCRVCMPDRNGGTRNGSFKTFATFLAELKDKKQDDLFSFDESSYKGISRPMEIECLSCRSTFTKAPKQLIYEKIGCPVCAAKSRGDSQRRTFKQFLALAQEKHGNKFTYHDAPDAKYGNECTVDRTCNTCNTREKQFVQSHIFGNGCKTCSGMRKHTTESFIELSKKIWENEGFDYSSVVYVNNKVPVTLRCKKKHEYQCAPSNHMSKRGCPHCAMKKFVSAGETEWLDSLKIPASNRNVWISVNGQKFNVDGLNGMTVYEYYGDFWHGNPARFKPDQVNVYCGLTMAELHEHTMEREQLLRDGGYVVMRMWESKWSELRKTRPKK